MRLLLIVLAVILSILATAVSVPKFIPEVHRAQQFVADAHAEYSNTVTFPFEVTSTSNMFTPVLTITEKEFVDLAREQKLDTIYVTAFPHRISVRAFTRGHVEYFSSVGYVKEIKLPHWVYLKDVRQKNNAPNTIVIHATMWAVSTAFYLVMITLLWLIVILLLGFFYYCLYWIVKRWLAA